MQDIEDEFYEIDMLVDHYKNYLVRKYYPAYSPEGDVVPEVPMIFPVNEIMTMRKHVEGMNTMYKSFVWNAVDKELEGRNK